MNKIYRYEWKGQNTNWDYRADFYCGSKDKLNNPDIVTLPKGSVEVLKRNVKLDKYPFGLSEGNYIDIKIHLSEIEDSSETRGFLNSIVYPIKEIDIDIPMINQGVSVTKNAKLFLGTVFKLYIRYNGNDEFIEGNDDDYRLDFIGIIRENNKMDIGKDVITAEVSAMDITTTILKSFNFNLLQDFDIWKNGKISGSTWKDDDNPNCSEYVITLVGMEGYDMSRIISKNKEGNLYYRFAKISTLFDYINYIRNIIGSYLLREEYKAKDIQTNIGMKVYKQQLYTENYEIGKELDIRDVYINSYVVSTLDDDIQIIGGLFAHNNQNGLNQKYKNSVWDFIKDLMESSLMIYDPIIKSESWFNYTYKGEYRRVFLNREEYISMKIEQNKDILKKVTASLENENNNSNGDFQNTEKYEITKNGTRNETEYTIPILWHTNPLVINYEIYSGGGWSVTYGSPHILQWGLYYKDKINNENIFALAHENIKNTNELDIEPQFIPKRATVNKVFKINEKAKITAEQICWIIQNCEDGGGYPRYIAQMLSNLFGNENQHIVELEHDFLHTDMSIGNGQDFFWNNLNTRYVLDWNNLGSYMYAQYPLWKPIEIVTNYDKETVLLKLYPDTTHAK